MHHGCMNGFAMLSALQADPSTREIAVIALSADAMPIDIMRGHEAGFREYLPKPIKLDLLRRSLESVITPLRND